MPVYDFDSCHSVNRNEIVVRNQKNQSWMIICMTICIVYDDMYADADNNIKLSRLG